MKRLIALLAVVLTLYPGMVSFAAPAPKVSAALALTGPVTSRVFSSKTGVVNGTTETTVEIERTGANGMRAVQKVFGTRSEIDGTIAITALVSIDFFLPKQTKSVDHRQSSYVISATRNGDTLHAHISTQDQEGNVRTFEQDVPLGSTAQYEGQTLEQLVQGGAPSHGWQEKQITGECGAISAICFTYALLFIECWPCYLAFWMECMMQAGCW